MLRRKTPFQITKSSSVRRKFRTSACRSSMSSTRKMPHNLSSANKSPGAAGVDAAGAGVGAAGGAGGGGGGGGGRGGWGGRRVRGGGGLAWFKPKNCLWMGVTGPGFARDPAYLSYL